MDKTPEKSAGDVFSRLKRYPDLYLRSVAVTARRIAVTAVWLLFWLAVYIIYRARINAAFVHGGAASNVLFLGAAAVILIVFPVFVFKALRLFNDKSYDGVVTGAKLDLRPKASYPGASRGGDMRDRDCIIIKVREDSGRNREYIYWEKEEINNLSFIRPGDRVTHYRELKYLYDADRRDGEKLCLVCGFLTFKDMEKCRRCGHTLI